MKRVPGSRADGWHATGGTVDILYERGVAQTTFDGKWEDHGLTAKAYADKFAEADATCGRLLTLLINEAQEAR